MIFKCLNKYYIRQNYLSEMLKTHINIKYTNGYLDIITHYKEYEWYPINYSGIIKHLQLECPINNYYIIDLQYLIEIFLSTYLE